MRISKLKRAIAFVSVVAAAGLGLVPAQADETCNSPYLSNLIKGQEDFLYVWTLGVKGMGDGFDKLVTLDVNPGSKKYGQVVAQVSVGARGEAHHAGFTDDRRFLWAGGLDDSKIHIFDVHSAPGNPKLVKTITDLSARSGLVGPHTYYAMPGRMLIGALSNAKDRGGATGMAMYSNSGDFISKYDMPTANGGDGHGYDLAINPARNAMLTSSFTGWNNYMMDLGTLMKNQSAMKQFGSTMVMWNLKAMQPEKVFNVPGAPLEIRWSLKEGDDWALTTTALTSKMWLIKKDAKGEWQAKEVATIGDPAKIPLPVDISITADSKGLWVNTFMDGSTRYFDISNPEAPRQTYAKHTGAQVNMISQSWDGKRIYVSTSLLENWDKRGSDNEQFVKLFAWDGKELKDAWAVDFYKLKLGRPHHMKLGANSLQRGTVAGPGAAALAGK
ncbi:MAG: selenium-binding protein [Collimonas fungivorans]|uniref:selenium-binding protein SBP56-related protein n=1 Tax=Collimonas fungivorans TaxID=158899 RepID=UPI0026F0F74D|nr:selenium-binding protein SBP56-related protein [Collimonas fungivorans]MDB5766284.1 selenium-binding protein [Collimonas fungivorans]